MRMDEKINIKYPLIFFKRRNYPESTLLPTYFKYWSEEIILWMFYEIIDDIYRKVSLWIKYIEFDPDYFKQVLYKGEH